MVLNELTYDLSLPVINKYNTILSQKMDKGFRIKSERNRKYNFIAAYIVKNALSRLPEFESLCHVKPCVLNNTLYFKTH